MLFDLHIHSVYSDGAATPGEIVAHAKRLGFSGIAVTDHNEVAGAKEAFKFNTKDFRVLPGLEVSSMDGHILALGVTQSIPRDLPAEDTVERIHAAGGIAIAAHPFDRLRQGVGDLIYRVKFDAIEVYNGHTIMSTRSVEDILDGLDAPVTGGSDAHLLSEIGSVVMDLPEGDPLEAIVKGRGRVTVNISKTRIIINHLKRKMVRRR